MSLGETSNINLLNIAKHLKIDLCVCSKDELFKNPNYENYIINMSDSNKPGTHWVALRKHLNEIYYFDSFGVICPREIYEHFKDEEITFSTIQVQDINSTDCGYYCLYWLWFMINNKDNYEKFLKVFDKKDLKKNDTTLLKKLNDILK